MTSKRQAVIFELLSGLFGWVWIGASLAAVGLIGMAFFADWSWWNVLYAVLTGGVAKWLTRGFIDNQRRVAFEEYAIQQGMSPEAAAQKWVEEYSKGNL